jgi:plasmid stabilization system protein ParE
MNAQVDSRSFPIVEGRGESRALANWPYHRPYIIVYRVVERLEAIEIVNVIHGAQRWLPAD